jgi:hypothetical protein
MKISFAFFAAVLALLLALLLCAAGQPTTGVSNPSFKPGADVTLEIKLKAPGGWKINYVPPIRFSFDAEKLKSAGFTVSKAQWEVKPGKYVKELTVSIPIKLKSGLKDGTLSVPVDIACSICDEPGVHCSFANESMTLKLDVKAKAPQGSAQPQTKGKFAQEHKLSPPM